MKKITPFLLLPIMVICLLNLNFIMGIIFLILFVLFALSIAIMIDDSNKSDNNKLDSKDYKHKFNKYSNGEIAEIWHDVYGWVEVPRGLVESK